MQEAKKQEDVGASIPLRSNAPFYLSIGFLLIISLSSIVFYTLTAIERGLITNMKEEIRQIDMEIATISKNPSIIIAKIVKDNTIRGSIDLRNIVTYFRVAAVKANVVFDGFSITDDTITTTITSTVGNTQHPDPVATIIQMMNDYTITEGKNFKLGAIRQITGDSKKRTTTVELTVIPTSSK